MAIEHWQQISRVPYNSAFYTHFTKDIPSEFRQWNSDDARWFIQSNYIEKANRLIARYYTTSPKTGLTWVEAWRVLYLLEGAPSYLIKATAECLLEDEIREDERLKIIDARRILLEL